MEHRLASTLSADSPSVEPVVECFHTENYATAACTSPTRTVHHESTFLAVFPIPGASHPADIMHTHAHTHLCPFVSGSH